MCKKVIISLVVISMLLTCTACLSDNEGEDSTTESSVTEDSDAPVVTITEETLASETTEAPTETPVETTETTTETTETEQNGEVNPDDFWETDASGRRIFHQDEYLDALGYTLMGYNAIYFFDNNSGSIIYDGGGDGFIYTPPSSSPDEFPETFVGSHISDGEEVIREFCGLEAKTHESSINDFINAAETFTHYRETQEIPNGYE